MTLKIAIQKGGRLGEESLQLLRDAGLRADAGSGALRVPVAGFPAEILFLRNADIPEYLADGVAHAAIVGENVLIEQGRSFPTAARLGFGRCRLSVAVPKTCDATEAEWLRGKRIATSYPHTVKKWLEEKNISAQIHTISGSVEIAPGIGLADSICDLVSSGSTLLSNGLREMTTILESEAVMVYSDNASEEQKTLVDELSLRVRSVINGRNYRYVLMNVPNDKVAEISEILPGMKSPTILPLATQGWSSLHSVVHLATMWDTLRRAREMGAEGILVTKLEAMVI
jgi:ATP phosphoribosyltransferase